jgi:hypothetical protein
LQVEVEQSDLREEKMKKEVEEFDKKKRDTERCLIIVEKDNKELKIKNEDLTLRVQNLDKLNEKLYTEIREL